VPQLPDRLEEGVLYICEEFSLTAHKCCCGCGEDVFNKLNSAKWRLTKMRDGSVSLEPSIGNWKYACKSHYWIRNNRVIAAGPMSDWVIEAVKQRDLHDRDRYIEQINKRKIPWWARIGASIGQVIRRLKSLW